MFSVQALTARILLNILLAVTAIEKYLMLYYSMCISLFVFYGHLRPTLAFIAF